MRVAIGFWLICEAIILLITHFTCDTNKVSTFLFPTLLITMAEIGAYLLC